MTTKQFTAEVGKVLDLMINSLYTNKDIFLRELISNASDACDKIRYMSQTDASLMKDDPDLKIKLSIDKNSNLLIIEDTGIGMNEEDMNKYLGTIAHSGTQHFLDHMSGDNKKDNKLIGQFGVGFYSAYLVASRVDVISRKATESSSYIWSSDGKEGYNVEESKENIKRGTRIILHIKDDAKEYLDEFRVKHIVKSYSDHISVPIYFIDDQKNEVQVNSSSAIWLQNKDMITPEQYSEFYRNIGYMSDDPWITLHNKNEGIVEFINLLFIPSSKTFDLFHPDRKRRVKLYIKRVFITDENIDIIPHYLRFIRGIVDAQDLSLNISRETLQQNPVIEKIKNSITKKIISELKKKKKSLPEEYEKFWSNFGAVMKEGLCEPHALQDDLLDSCIFYSAKKDKLIDLNEYVENMQSGQQQIYYISGDNVAKLKHSPQIEGLLSKDIDVLLFSDSVDDFWVNVVNKYKDIELKSATRDDVNIQDNLDNKKEEEKKEDAKDITHGDLIKFFKDTLKEKVKDIKISKKLTSSPVCLAVAAGDMDIRMERFLLEQKQLKQGSTKILELNPDHPLIQRIDTAIKSGKNEGYSDLVSVLFAQACLIEGEPIDDVYDVAKKMNSILMKVY